MVRFLQEGQEDSVRHRQEGTISMDTGSKRSPISRGIGAEYSIAHLITAEGHALSLGSAASSLTPSGENAGHTFLAGTVGRNQRSWPYGAGNPKIRLEPACKETGENIRQCLYFQFMPGISVLLKGTYKLCFLHTQAESAINCSKLTEKARVIPGDGLWLSFQIRKEGGAAVQAYWEGRIHRSAEKLFIGKS